jgi:hypothetical protein
MSNRVPPTERADLGSMTVARHPEEMKVWRGAATGVGIDDATAFPAAANRARVARCLSARGVRPPGLGGWPRGAE